MADLPPPAHPEPREKRSRWKKKKAAGDSAEAQQPASASKGAVEIATASAFGAGKDHAYLQKYQADLDRLLARNDIPDGVTWVDSHCHLESILCRSWRGGDKPQVKEREPLLSLPELVESWPASLEWCICNCVFRRPGKPGATPEWIWIKENLHFFESSPISHRLWFSVGIHPHDAENWDAEAEATVRRLALHEKCVGIGECGLDFFKHGQQAADGQLRAFRAQVAIAVECKKALVVHARLVTPENEDLCMRTLQELLPKEHRVHIHCYSDSLKHALELCEYWPNLRIGFTGAITFKDAKGKGGQKGKIGRGTQDHCRELIEGIPLERLLIETDGPYMCPEPFRGQTSHPGHVHRVAEQIAEWQQKPVGEVLRATRESARVVYAM
mmetsp:Transcript_27955/g.61655  ORF Transcript_27955/g.61655 Transcript_27955/m.61655 type:complete len:385 (-) Transcript_27955:65-1219(-)